MNLNEILTSKAIASYYSEVYSNKIAPLGRALCPAKRIPGVDMAWFMAEKGLTPMLMPSTYDAKATFRDPIGFEKLSQEMPLFRQAYLIDERSRKEINRAMTADDPYLIQTMDFIGQRTSEAIEGANVVPERMIWQVLAPTDGTPKISIVANGASYVYNYDSDGSWKKTNYVTVDSNKWNDPNTCDPISDMQNAAEAIQAARGITITRAVMNQKTFNYIVKSKAVRDAVLAQNVTANVRMTSELAKQVVRSLLGIDVIVYNKQFADEQKSAKYYIPDDTVTLLPDGTIGNTYYGETPEEIGDLPSGAAEFSVMEPGISIVKVNSVDPVHTKFVFSEVVLPSFENLNDVMVMKVV